ncbi:MAG: hypothetical protein PHU08_03245 [Dehalococcoidales bacterium]|nr:hypothetical protein [Dehalococcoidales bacterium]
MSVLKRTLAFSLAIILPLTAIACSQNGPATEGAQPLTQQESQQLVTDSVNNGAKVTTYKFDMNMDMAMEAVGGKQAGKFSVALDGSGTADNTSKEMQMAMKTTLGLPGQPEQKMAMDLYLMSDWIYVKGNVSGAGAQWVKTRTTQEIIQSWDMVSQQLELLAAPKEIKFLTSENVDGIPCYVISVTPNIATLGKWLSQQQSTGGQNFDWSSLDLTNLLKELSYKYWIAKDTHLLAKLQAHMVMEISPEDMQASADDFERMTMDLDLDMKIHDYNQAVSIQLPPEAVSAQEMANPQ